MMYIRVILPLNIPILLTYSAPDGSVTEGDRVNVTLAGRSCCAVVAETDVRPDVDAGRIMPISSTADGLSRITKAELLFWKFLCEYYLCTPGEVLKTAYPKLKVRSETGAAAFRVRMSSRAAQLESLLSGKKPGTKIYATMSARLEAIRARLSDMEPSSGSGSLAPDGQFAAAKGEKPLALVGHNRVPSYLERTRAALDGGFGVLLIAPTARRARFLADKFSERFPGQVCCYLASDTAAGRRRVMDNLRAAVSPYIIVGTRPSLFLPFHSLGLVIVDEEQDPVYKQNESGLRFSCRDAAVMLAFIHRARAVLGSSSPSFETLHNIGSGKYLREECPDFCGRTVEVVDVTAEKRKRGFDGLFSYRAIDAVRRGGCRSLRVVYGWEDREEVASGVASLFPDADVELAGRGECGAVSTLVDATIILQADALFRREDFRSDEKAFQLLERLAGLSRLLIVQTSKPEHNVFLALTASPGEYGGVYGRASLMVEERRLFALPPFSRLIDVIVEDASVKRLRFLSSVLEDRLRGLGAPLLRISDSECSLRLRLTVPKSAPAFKTALSSSVSAFVTEFRYPGHIVIDVDPNPAK